jgi:hypothetical protein
MRSFFTKKRSLVALGAIAALVIAGTAFAYFTGTGSGTGTAAVGSSASWTVSPGTATGTMYPGNGTTTIPFTVTNAGGGNQNLAGETATVVADTSGNIVHGTTSVSGCLASWFTATVTTPVSGDLAAGATSGTGDVTVSMSDASTSQDYCKGATPDVTIGAL